MRIARLFGVFLVILTAGLQLAAPAAAQQPFKLTDHITDSSNVLTDSGRAAVSSAIDRLYSDRHIQLWVVYVNTFARFKPENWADRTRTASGMGNHDALLAVATSTNASTKKYALSAPSGVRSITQDKLSSLESRQIEPAVDAKDWSRAAVAAADGLNELASSKWNWMPIAIAAAVVVLVLLLVLLIYRRRRRRRSAGRVDPSDGQAAIDGGGDDSLERALSVADARLRQISDYVAKHRGSIGAEAQARLEEAKRHLAAAHGKEAGNAPEAIAHANGASTLAAQAQTLANADVLGAQKTRRR